MHHIDLLPFSASLVLVSGVTQHGDVNGFFPGPNIA